MREILFRAKRLDNGEWVEGNLVFSLDADEEWRAIIIPIKNSYMFSSGNEDEDLGFENWYRVDPNTVCQYTGLTDKNGVKIFEGDIVRSISMYDKSNMVVIFEDGEFRMVLCEKYKEYIPGCVFYAIRCFDKEVIGNIFENHELLKGGAK